MKQVIMVFSCLLIVFCGDVNISQANIFDVLGNIEEQSPNAWNFDSLDNDFVPKRGGIKICKSENQLIIGFYLSQNNFDFYNQKFSNGERKPLGFEIDVIDDTNGNSVFDNDDYEIVNNDLPLGVFYRENHMGDDYETHTLAISDPTQLIVKKWYTVIFQFHDHQELTPGTFQIQVQLVGDMEKIRDDYPDVYGQYTLPVRTALTSWLITHSEMGETFFNLRNPFTMFWGNKFFQDYDRVVWDMNGGGPNGDGKYKDFKPYHCGFGSDPWEEMVGGGSSNDDGNGVGPDNNNGNNSSDDSGSDNSNGNNGDSNHTNNSNTSNPWAGYAHHVGLKYLKIGKKSSGRWDGSRTWVKEEIPSKKDFRIKLKQKGGVWPDGDICTEVWFSHNKHFTDKDLFLERECKNLSNETRDERSIYVKNIKLPTMEAGNSYYFFTVVTYPGGTNPSSEDDHDEYVKVTITTDNPNSSTTPEFAWSSAGPISGMECVQILETADPDTWNDNYFCSKEYEGIAWSSAGPISGMRCTQITEAAEPSSHTWNDNYLCVVPESNLNFYWNSAGPIPNKNCVQWLETADPHTWNDNYLCWDRNHNQLPTGFLDSANCNQFTGWARDPNTTDSISIHFYADGEAGVGTYIGGVTANQYRGDLPFNDKNHGFTFRTPASIKDGHQHHIYAYGIDEQNQVNSLLNNSPLTINHCISPAVMQVLKGFYLEGE